MSAPIERQIDAVVRCTKCGTPGIGNCSCWDEPCVCCSRPVSVGERNEVRQTWEGRLDGFCIHCSHCRCDAYPDECPFSRRRAGYEL